MLYSESSNLKSKALRGCACRRHSLSYGSVWKFKSACLSSTRRTLLEIGPVSPENFSTLSCVVLCPRGVQENPVKLNQGAFVLLPVGKPRDSYYTTYFVLVQICSCKTAEHNNSYLNVIDLSRVHDTCSAQFR